MATTNDLIRKADWVYCISDNRRGRPGLVKRVAKDKSWADVRWISGDVEWVKRMKSEYLEIVHTIPSVDGMTVTDMNRKAELEQANYTPT